MRPRYALLAALIVCALHYDAGCPAAAQSWPTRPLTMVVPFAAGGGTDVLGRIIGQRLSEILGQQVIIDNLHMGIEAQQCRGFWREYLGRVTGGVTDQEAAGAVCGLGGTLQPGSSAGAS